VVRFGYSAFAITFGFLVLCARLYSGSPHFWVSLLRLSPLRSFGKYSFAIYVLHPIFAGQLREAARSWMPHGYWPGPGVILVCWLVFLEPAGKAL